MKNGLFATDPNATLDMNLNETQKQRSQTLYYVLVRFMEDVVLKKMGRVGEGEGLRSWRRLEDDFETDV